MGLSHSDPQKKECSRWLCLTNPFRRDVYVIVQKLKPDPLDATAPHYTKIRYVKTQHKVNTNCSFLVITVSILFFYVVRSPDVDAHPIYLGNPPSTFQIQFTRQNHPIFFPSFGQSTLIDSAELSWASFEAIQFLTEPDTDLASFSSSSSSSFSSSGSLEVPVGQLPSLAMKLSAP